jgi:hypothetical protein
MPSNGQPRDMIHSVVKRVATRHVLTTSDTVSSDTVSRFCTRKIGWNLHWLARHSHAIRILARAHVRVSVLSIVLVWREKKGTLSPLQHAFVRI